MSTALQVLRYAGQQVRTVMVDGQPHFVASDVCAVLGIANHRDALSRLEEHEKGVGTADTPGGPPSMATVTESGIYALTFSSRKPEARDFRVWVTSEVLPSIRRTGSYTAPAAAPARQFRLPETFAEALRELADTVEQRDAAQALADQREIPARAWDELATAEGDYSVADAAKVLASRAGIQTGQNRLFAKMADLGWIYRKEGVWHAYQSAVEARRYLAEKLNPPRVDRFTGERHAVAPTIRVTGKGIERLLRELAPAPAAEPLAPLRVVNGGEDW